MFKDQIIYRFWCVEHRLGKRLTDFNVFKNVSGKQWAYHCCMILPPQSNHYIYWGNTTTVCFRVRVLLHIFNKMMDAPPPQNNVFNWNRQETSTTTLSVNVFKTYKNAAHPPPPTGQPISGICYRNAGKNYCSNRDWNSSLRKWPKKFPQYELPVVVFMLRCSLSVMVMGFHMPCWQVSSTAYAIHEGQHGTGCSLILLNHNEGEVQCLTIGFTTQTFRNLGMTLVMCWDWGLLTLLAMFCCLLPITVMCTFRSEVWWRLITNHCRPKKCLH